MTSFKNFLLGLALLSSLQSWAQLPDIGKLQIGKPVPLSHSESLSTIQSLKGLSERLSSYYCLRNINNFGSEALYNQARNYQNFSDKKSGDLFSQTSLTSTLPLTGVGLVDVLEDAEVTRTSETEYSIEYSLEFNIQRSGPSGKVLSESFAQRVSDGRVRHQYALQNGNMVWMKASYDLEKRQGYETMTKPHVRCVRQSTDSKVHPSKLMNDLTLKQNRCAGGLSQCRYLMMGTPIL